MGEGKQFDWILERGKCKVATNACVQNKKRVCTLYIVDEINERTLDEHFMIQNLSLSKFTKYIKGTFSKAETHEINKLFYKIVASLDEMGKDD